MQLNNFLAGGLLLLSAVCGAAGRAEASRQAEPEKPPVAAAPAKAAEAQPLSLREALELALRTDPAISSAMAARDRSNLAVLRAQLDRFSLRIDSFLTEQWRAQNLGGATPPSACATLFPAGSLFAPVQLLSPTGESPTQAQCEAAMGQYLQPDTVSSGGLGQFNLSANLQVPIFSGFRVTATVDRARHQRDAASATLRDVHRQVALSALRAYWLVRRVEARQQVSAQAIARYDESVAVVAARVRAGLAPASDINRMETRRQSELVNQADLRGTAAEARAQLAVALGLGGTSLALSESLEVLPAPPASAEEVESFLDAARRDRPDLRAAHFSTLAAADVIRFQRGNYYPQLSASSLLQFSNNPFNPLIGARSANASANPFTNITGSIFFGGTLSINLFDTLNTWTGVRDAKFEHRRMTEEERRIGRSIESDVRTLHARLLHYYGMREPLLRTREIARDTLDIIERRYKNGDVTILDFIDVQVELLNSEIGLANAASNIAQTWGELYLATGRLPP
jgi:outer membrane protein